MSPSTNVLTSVDETPNILVKIVPGRNLSEQGLRQIESTSRIQRTREAVERMQ